MPFAEMATIASSSGSALTSPDGSRSGGGMPAKSSSANLTAA